MLIKEYVTTIDWGRECYSIITGNTLNQLGLNLAKLLVNGTISLEIWKEIMKAAKEAKPMNPETIHKFPYMTITVEYIGEWVSY